MGGNHYRDPKNDDEVDKQAIRNAINAGISHIDTAEMYAGGHTEELVGEVLKEYQREKIFLASKVWPNHLKYEDVINSCKGSLKRLGVEYLDLYIIHAPNPEIPIKDTIKAFDKLKGEGMIKNIGVSNFSVASFEKAQRASQNKIVYNQLHYNLMIREVETRGLDTFCQENDVILSAWRPVQKGLFAKKNYQILNNLTVKYHKTPTQIAINWLISQKNVTTLSKMRNALHLQENLGAVGWEMDLDDIENLRENFPEKREISDATSVSII